MFIHSLADVASQNIGDDTRIWQFCVVLTGAQIGSQCNVCSHCFIENDVIVGDRVTIKNGVQLWDGIRLADDVFIGPDVTFTNDSNPRSRQIPDRFLETHVLQGASIGANATILPGLTIGKHSLVGAGSVVTTDVPDHAIVFGNPARLKAWTCVCGERLALGSVSATCACGQFFYFNDGLLQFKDQ